jgi:phosphate transport system ATP-binding protein
MEESMETDETVPEGNSETKEAVPEGNSETRKKTIEEGAEKFKVKIENVNGWYGSKRAIKDVNLDVKEKSVTAFIGPSGCGKTTLLRCLNRMHEMTPGAHADGRVVLDGIDIYDKSIDPVVIRRRIGMVFQKPNPFPTMSIFDNVAAGLRLNGMRNKTIIREIVEESLKNAALWEEVKNQLEQPGMSLSGGQQQRLCIARALAMQPEVLLMDEPTSSLDPIGSSKIEELVRILKDSVTIIIVTHNMQQAARGSDFTAFMYLGDLIEYVSTNQIFMKPEKELTERYISGKFG